jgi:hypothetical protein
VLTTITAAVNAGAATRTWKGVECLEADHTKVGFSEVIRKRSEELSTFGLGYTKVASQHLHIFIMQ